MIGIYRAHNIKWWKCKDEIMVEYKERVRRKYEKLDAEKGTVEGEQGVKWTGRLLNVCMQEGYRKSGGWV